MKKPVTSTILSFITAIPTIASAAYTFYKLAEFSGAGLFSNHSFRWILRNIFEFLSTGHVVESAEPYLAIAVSAVVSILLGLLTFAIFHDCTEKISK